MSNLNLPAHLCRKCQINDHTSTSFYCLACLREYRNEYNRLNPEKREKADLKWTEKRKAIRAAMSPNERAAYNEKQRERNKARRKELREFKAKIRT